MAIEHAYGLYTHIRSNQRRSVVLMIGLFLLVYVMVFAGALVAEALMGDASLQWLLQRAEYDFVVALPWATIGTVIWIAIAYWFHQSLIDAVTGGYEVTRRDQPHLWNLLENLCISRGIAMPKLKLMESPALNAFATGLNSRQYSVTVTTGLLQTLNDSEIEAVLGHELTHIRNGDVRLLVIAVVITGVISFFGELIYRIFFQSMFWGGGRRRGDDEERRGSGGAGLAILIALVLIALAWLFSVMIRLALSRSREFLADAGSVELTKNPDAMIKALRKIEGRGDLAGANSAIMEMCVDNPREDMADLFDTHPSIQKRIDALVRFAGGHDPGPLALAAPEAEGGQTEEEAPSAAAGPWGAAAGGAQPFLPRRPPVELGGPDSSPPDAPPQPWGSADGSSEIPSGESGPWGPRQGT